MEIVNNALYKSIFQYGLLVWGSWAGNSLKLFQIE